MTYGTPKKRNHHCTVIIRVTMPTAIRTTELFVRPQTNMQALMASLTCIGRINNNDRNPVTNPFVFKELTQLVECPTIRTSSFRFVARFFVRIFHEGPSNPQWLPQH